MPNKKKNNGAIIGFENKLWEAADELRANSKLKAHEYSVPVLGLIFLRYADFKFAHAEEELKKKSSGRREIGKTDYQAKGIMYLPPESRFSHLLNLPEASLYWDENSIPNKRVSCTKDTSGSNPSVFSV